MNRTASFLIILSTAACASTTNKASETATQESVDTSAVDAVDTSTSEEVCDGVDNDGDGLVDNGLEFENYWLDSDAINFMITS